MVLGVIEALVGVITPYDYLSVAFKVSAMFMNLYPFKGIDATNSFVHFSPHKEIWRPFNPSVEVFFELVATYVRRLETWKERHSFLYIDSFL